MSMFDDYLDHLENSRYCDIDIRKSDKQWIDGNGVIHNICEMDIAHVEACIRFCHKNGYVTPDAFFKRWGERHKVIAKVFDDEE